MPANLPPDARKKWAEVEATKSPRERLVLMQEFLSLVPKHKGTAKTCAQVKKQMANIRKELEERKRKQAKRTGPKVFLEKEGAAQIAVIGLTNVGKSSLLSSVTNAKVEISTSPYTTKEPTPGILVYQDLQFQIVETPALMVGAADGKAWGLQTLAFARNADALIIVLDLSGDPIDQLALVLAEMGKARILVNRPKARVEIERKFMGAGMRIMVLGRLMGCTFKDVENLLQDYRISDAIVKIYGEATLHDVEDAVFESTVYKSAIIVANKIDLKGAEENLRMLRTHVGNQLPIVASSCITGKGLERLGGILFENLGLVRVYTREPSEREPSKNPFTLKKGCTVYDLAKNIHSDFSENFSFAKVWSKRLAFSPQKVGSAFVLEDGDVVEIHLK